MSEKLKVGILGATGMVGQRFITLLENHPWFEVVTLAASAHSAGKTYAEAVGDRWKMETPMPEYVKNMVVVDGDDAESVASGVDFMFSAVNMPKDQIRAIEERYAKTETPVVSNNSAHRWTPDVPMVVPEINPEHFEVIEHQRKHVDAAKGEIVPFDGDLKITSQCIRVPVLNGHTATVFLNFGKKATKEELIDRLVNYTSKASELELPHAPKHFIQYLTEDDRPQVKLDVDYEGGMGVSIGRLREDSIFDWKFVGLAHNTLRGAAGGALECAEMLKALGYITKK